MRGKNPETRKNGQPRPGDRLSKADGAREGVKVIAEGSSLGARKLVLTLTQKERLTQSNSETETLFK